MHSFLFIYDREETGGGDLVRNVTRIGEIRSDFSNKDRNSIADFIHLWTSHFYTLSSPIALLTRVVEEVSQSTARVLRCVCMCVCNCDLILWDLVRGREGEATNVYNSGKKCNLYSYVFLLTFSSCFSRYCKLYYLGMGELKTCPLIFPHSLHTALRDKKRKWKWNCWR